MYKCCLLLFALLPAWIAGADPAVPGTRIENLTFKDIRYLPRTLDDFGAPKVWVIAFLTNTCPIARRYLPRLTELEKTYAPQGVQFLAVNVGPDDTIMDMARHALEFGVPFPMLKDMTGEAARRVGATRTPEIAVLDADRVLRYRGRVDAQYRLGGVRPGTGREDLRLAIEAVLAGREVEVPTTPADGCSITFPAPPEPDDRITHAEFIAPVLLQHCAGCHHEGGSAPFSLTSYQDARAHAAMIAEVVAEGRMPPWYAHPEFGVFENAPGMNSRDRGMIRRWVAAGCPEGDPALAPQPPESARGEWAFVPDLVLEAPAAIDLPASGFVDYKYVFLKQEFSEDTWVQAIQIRAANARVLHHANLFFQPAGAAFDRSRHFLTGTVPGNVPRPLPEGMALLIPKGARLGLQIHYVTTGKPESDQPQVALMLPKSPVRQRVFYKILDDDTFEIPPGAPFFPVRGTATLEADATVVAIFGHMHLRGRDMTFTARLPEGREEILLCMPNYSFDWQLSYYPPRDTLRLPAGTEIECLAHFDNSAFNPYNPDPAKTVTYGPQTVDEMMQGFLFYTLDDEQTTAATPHPVN